VEVLQEKEQGGSRVGTEPRCVARERR